MKPLSDERQALRLTRRARVPDLELVDRANAEELASIAQEVGAEVVRGALRYPSLTGGWQLGDLDLSEHLTRYRDQELVVIIASGQRRGSKEDQVRMWHLRVCDEQAGRVPSAS